MLTVEILGAGAAQEYEEFLHRSPASLLFASFKHRAFLQRVLEDAQSYYLVARQEGRIVGALPVFIRRHAVFGSVANSLPFFGSNGGLLLETGSNADSPVGRALLGAWLDLCRDQQVAAGTLISSPLAEHHAFYQAQIAPDCLDYRIGQITELPASLLGSHNGNEPLMESFHYKTRNSVRKAQKSDLDVISEAGSSAMRDLWEIHRENMASINGQAKPMRVFEEIEQVFEYGQDYKIYRAQREGKLVASLLVFFYNKTAEYYTPCTVAEYREFQPMSLLIYEAMKEAVERGCRYWNWGGTWVTQSGVYQFKKRWGTTDYPYWYYTKVFDRGILSRSAGELLQAFPYFYVVPFSKLAGAASPGAQAPGDAAQSRR